MTVYSDSSSGDESAVGLIIPKKMIPLAVTRNYIRRRIYAFFTSLPEKRTKKKRRIIHITKPIKKTKRKNLSEILEEEIKTLLGKE